MQGILRLAMNITARTWVSCCAMLGYLDVHTVHGEVDILDSSRQEMGVEYDGSGLNKRKIENRLVKENMGCVCV